MENLKHKSGLHKKISSIFDGVPVPPKTGDNQPSSPAAEFKGHVTPKPPVAAGPQFSPKVIQSPPARTFQQDISVKPYKQSISDYVTEKLSDLKTVKLVDKQKIKILIIPFLAIIFVFILYRNFRSPIKEVSRNPVSGQVTNTIMSGEAIAWQKPEPYPETMRDPTQLGAVSSFAAGTSSIIVRGIVYSDDKPSAVIGNDILHEGDTLGTVTILKINKDSVEFSGQGKSWTQSVQ